MIRGRVLLGAAPGEARLVGRSPRSSPTPARRRRRASTSRSAPAAAAARLDAAVFNPDAPGAQRFKALVLDATGIADSTHSSCCRPSSTRPYAASSRRAA